jgi:hypothetical protein
MERSEPITDAEPFARAEGAGLALAACGEGASLGVASVGLPASADEFSLSGFFVNI